ncbi:MAG: prepilin-type N-terminal cleavage/methylation domain-containing protein [Candidatus Gastranaerophilales bacterium]|nr:prepilin-type N-terminal cleavage/methylation domain-containing protein [Candidatus Gastranaerophilales bacterium]
MCSRKSAFTLSEVLISMTLIGILVVVMLSITNFSDKNAKVIIGKKQQAESLIVSVSKALSSGDTTGLALTAYTESDAALKEAFADKLNTKNEDISLSNVDDYNLPEGMPAPESPLPAVELVNGTKVAFQVLNTNCAKLADGGAPCALAYVDVNEKSAGDEKAQFMMAIYRDRAASEYELCSGYTDGEKTVELECPSDRPNGKLTRTDTCSFGTIATGDVTDNCCPSGQTYGSNGCECINKDLIISGSQCVCPQTKPNFNTKTGKCVETCVGNKVWNVSKNACVCPATLPDLIDGECTCTDKTEACSGAKEGTIIYKATCSDTGKTFAADPVNTCKCPKTLPDEINGKCVCSDIVSACSSPKVGSITYTASCSASGRVKVAEKANTCTCPAKEKITLKTNEVYSPLSETCTTCLDPDMKRAADGSCICPDGKPYLDARTKKCIHIPSDCACREMLGNKNIVVKPITSEDDLKKIGRDSGYPLKNACYCQIRDLNFSSENNTILCTKADKKTQVNVPVFPLATIKADCTEDTNNQTFESVYDGGKYTINGVNINTNTDYRGLFAKLNNAKILNLNLNSCDIKGKNYVGGLAGYSTNSPVENVNLTCNVTGTSYVGGLIGQNNTGSPVKDSSHTGSINASSTYTGGLIGQNTRSNLTNISHVGEVTSKGNKVGGLVGENNINSPIINATSTGNVKAGSYDANDKYTGSGSNTGGLIGLNYSALTNTHAAGNVTGGYYIGGLVGNNQTSAPIKNSSFSNGAVTSRGTHDGYSQVGGLVGVNQSPIDENSYADATEVFGSGHRVGGLIGDNRAKLERVYSTSKIITSGTQQAGGLIGYNSGAVTNAYATGAVTASNIRAGGLIGYTAGVAIKSCYATGAVNAGSSGYAGGLIGELASGSVLNAYATGSVTAPDHAGGLIGVMRAPLTYGYSTGKINSSGSNVGGLIGWNSSKVNSSYWNMETSGQTTSKGGLGRNTEEMTSAPDGYTYADWETQSWCFSCGFYPVPTGAPTSMPYGAAASDICKYTECVLDSCPDYGRVYLIINGHGYNKQLKALLSQFSCIPRDQVTQDELVKSGASVMFIMSEKGELIKDIRLQSNINDLRVYGGKIDANGDLIYSASGSVTTSGCGGHESSKTGGTLIMKLGTRTCTYDVQYLLKQQSPLVLDLKGDGLKFTSAEEGTKFDLNIDGIAEQTGWTGIQKDFDNAFLCLDKNNNGNIDNGSELFGDQNGEDSGFAELAKYDKPEYGGNGNKFIDSGDEYFDKLLLWVDFNNNGVVDYECLDKDYDTALTQKYQQQIDDYKQAKANYEKDLAAYNTAYDNAVKKYCYEQAKKYCSKNFCFFYYGAPQCSIPDNIPGFNEEKPIEPEIPRNINGWLAHPDNAKINLLDMFRDVFGKRPSGQKYCFTKELKHLKDVNITELSTQFDVILEDDSVISGDDFTKSDLVNAKKDEYGNTIGLVGSFKMMVEEVVNGVVQFVEKVGLMIDVFFKTVVENVFTQ